MPDDITSQILETLLAMPKEKRADAFKKIKESGVQLGSPEDMQRLNKMFGGGDMYLPPLPGGPKMRPDTFETVYGPTGPTQVRQLGPEREATQANVAAIAANKPRSLNPMDWLTSGGKSPVPAAVEGGANFLAGMTNAAIQTPGDWRAKLMSGLGRGAANVLAGEAMNAATGREPEAGSAHNITSLIPSLPKRTGGVIGTNALSAGLGEYLDTGSADQGLVSAATAAGITGALQGGQAAVRSGMVAPAARQDLAKELHKRRSAPPAATGGFSALQKNSEFLSKVTDQEKAKLQNYRPENFDSRRTKLDDDFAASQTKLDDELSLKLNTVKDPKAQAYHQEKHRIASEYLLNKHQAKIGVLERDQNRMEELIKSGLNIKDMDEPTWKEAKRLIKENETEAYSRIIDPIFSSKNYSELPQAAKLFNQNVTNVATLAGKDRAAVLKGVRNAFVQKLFEDNDVRNTGQIVNPDSLRYRMESIGPDMFNQIFSDSPNPKNQASGAYDAFKTIIDLAEQGSRTNKYHDLKVFITRKGPALLRIPLVGSILETPLDQDAMFKGKNKSTTAMAAAALGVTSPGAALGVGSLEVAEFSWDKFFDTFAKKNSRTLPILKAISSGDKTYSQASIDRAIQTMFDLADRREKRKLTGETWEDSQEMLK